MTYRDPSTNAEVSSEEQITVQDHLVVSLGDSYGAGEGAVDRPIPTRYGWGQFEGEDRYGYWPTGEAKWVDKRCHRSANAGAAQAARSLEYADPHSSVTFISFACSGATVNRPTELALGLGGKVPQGSGMLGPYRGIDPPPGPADDPQMIYPENWLPPQVDALARTLAGCAPTDETCVNRQGRKIDSLVVSGGGNDVYFADILQTCMLEDNCGERDDVGTMVNDGLGELPNRYTALAHAIHNQSPTGRPALDVSKVYLTQYPDPTRDDDGSTCESILGDIIWTKSINRVESDWARANVIAPLNQTMADAAAQADAASADTSWAYVDGISSQFGRHGYCADSRWIVQPMDSRRMQGPYRVLPFEEWEHTDVLGAQKGMMHPNAEGYRAYSNSLVPLLRSQLDQIPVESLGPLPAFSSSASVPDATSRWGENGWITGAYSTTTLLKNLNEAVVTVAVEDPDGIASGEVVINGVNPCNNTNAVQCSVVDTSAQRKEWRFRFREDGIYRLEFVAQGADGQSATYSYEARVDLNDPEVTVEAARPPDAYGKYTSPVDVTLRGADQPGGSGVFKVRYTIADGPVQELASGDKVTLQPDETRLRYWAVDHAGRKGGIRDFIARDRIAFSASREGDAYPQIWATDTDGAFPARITDTGLSNISPSFSPDGKKLVFEGRDGFASPEIYQTDADGSNLINLTNNPTEDRVPDFSPDGKKIAFERTIWETGSDGVSRGRGEVFVMNADGTNQTRLTFSGGTSPAFSPDGSKIAFASYREGNSEIYVMNANGSNQTRLTDHPKRDDQPTYSPDGKKIAFTSDRDGNSEIYVMNANGADPTNITNNSEWDDQVAFSPDGSKIAFARISAGGIYVANADGTNPTHVTSGLQPDWILVYNDAFAEPRAITGNSASIAGSTLVATREADEPNHSSSDGLTGDNSVWYRWTAPASGTVEVDTCEANFDTIFSVYTGGSLGSLKRIADNNNACPSGGGSKLTFEATSGTVYNIAISGAGGTQAGIFTLKLGLVVDTTPPPAPVITSPTGNLLDRDGVFTVSGTAEPNSTIRLREGEEFKGGAPVGADGAWSARLTGIPEGAHTYVAEASDKAGNTSAASNPATVTVDSTAPTLTAVTPPVDATGVAVSENVTATFSEAMDATTLTNATFTLTRQGATTTPVAAAVGYDATSRKATLDPEANLEADALYTASVKGWSGGAKDAAGNPLAQDKVWSFRTADTTPPETTLAPSGPQGTVNTTSASFSFSSEAGATFECRLTKQGETTGSFTACSSPKGYTALTNGSYTFQVRAKDAAGNVDASPASRTWKVDTIKPTISGMSPRHTSIIRDTTPTIRATVRDNLTNLRKANIKLYVAGKLISPTKYSYSAATDKLTYNSPRLAKGKKTVRIIATDAARNVGAKSWYFTIR